MRQIASFMAVLLVSGTAFRSELPRHIHPRTSKAAPAAEKIAPGILSGAALHFERSR